MCDPGGAIYEDLVGLSPAVVDQRSVGELAQGVGRLIGGAWKGGQQGAGLPGEVGGQVGRGGRDALGPRAARQQRTRAQVERVLLDDAVGQHHHDHHRGVTERDELNRPDQRLVVCRTHDHTRVAGEVAEEPGCLVQHLFQLAVGLTEEGADLLGAGSIECRRRLERVDEEPVALLSGHPARRGVGLPQVPLLLEGHHVVANRRRGDLHLPDAGDVR